MEAARQAREGALDGPLLTYPEEPKARRTRRAPKAAAHWPPPVAAEESIRRILAALSDAREAAGWPAGRVRTSTPLRREQHGRLALRLHQLHEDGEVEPERLLIAVMQAKVHEHRRKDGEHGTGTYCNAESLCRDAWWSANLAAGRAWLASGSKSTAVHGRGVRAVEGGRINANGSFTPTGKYSTADIFEET